MARVRVDCWRAREKRSIDRVRRGSKQQSLESLVESGEMGVDILILECQGNVYQRPIPYFLKKIFVCMIYYGRRRAIDIAVQLRTVTHARVWLQALN